LNFVEEVRYKMKHTPGPWEYWKAHNFEGFAIAQRGTLPTLAGVYNFPEETEANACLIAAAPKMEDILKKLIKWETDPDNYLGDLADLAQEARELMDEIEGRVNKNGNRTNFSV
jgi:hypothetical protein